jgi:hypothetical protein
MRRLVSPRVAVGSVALLGDAAFVARPHVGGDSDLMAVLLAMIASGDCSETGLLRAAAGWVP